MSAENETIEDVVGWVRKRPCMFGYRDMNALADRIEAAAKREKSIGNAAKLREAMILVQEKINYLIGSLTVPNSLVANRMEINGIINAALATPARSWKQNSRRSVPATPSTCYVDGRTRAEPGRNWPRR